ncbi:LOW QUALITY PROTEIN: hypothetical protein ACHAW5_000202 [Stephanodiscus triporus]|uniref:Uncharacterized protein n=1 Tax=Stephanodiscus triporus TaxID=2934178 RepID=A0ABD3MF99_9STRA
MPLTLPEDIERMKDRRDAIILKENGCCKVTVKKMGAGSEHRLGRDIDSESEWRRRIDMEEEMERRWKGGERGGGRGQEKRNGSDGDESIAEMMSGIQLKFRPSKMPEERTQAIGVVEANPFPYNYPKIRYVPWHDLSKETKEIVEEEFGYNVVSWNYIASSSNAFSTFDAKQQKSLLMLGIDENVWDCFINHYMAYDRGQLEEFGLGRYADTLLAAQSMDWKELSAAERKRRQRNFASLRRCGIEKPSAPGKPR